MVPASLQKIEQNSWTQNRLQVCHSPEGKIGIMRQIYKFKFQQHKKSSFTISEQPFSILT